MRLAPAAVSTVLFCCMMVVRVAHAQTAGARTWASDDLTRLASWLSGSFSSQEQASVDSDYYDIRLQMVPMWPHRTDGYWLYVEQASALKLDRPYRQRVNRLTQRADGTFESAVYTIPDPLRFAGDWRNPRPLAGLTPDSLTRKEGCSVILVAKGDQAFQGGTVGAGCPSEHRGAAYATSDVLLTAASMISWDRGFDSLGRQAWGAVKRGYVFKKLGGCPLR